MSRLVVAAACFLGCAAPVRPPVVEKAPVVPEAASELEWDPRTGVIRCPDGSELQVPKDLIGFAHRSRPDEIIVAPEGTSAGSALVVTVGSVPAKLIDRLVKIWPTVHRLATGRALEQDLEGGNPNVYDQGAAGNHDGGIHESDGSVDITAATFEYPQPGQRWKLAYFKSGSCQALAVDRLAPGVPQRLTQLVNGMPRPMAVTSP